MPLLFGLSVPIGGIVSVEVMTELVGRVVHKGIVSDKTGSDGQPTIIHSSHLHGRVLESTATEFISKRCGEVRYLGYPGRVHPLEVVRRARRLIGNPYRALTANCEHFVSGVHGMQPSSPQLRDGAAKAGMVGGAIAIIVAAARTASGG